MAQDPESQPSTPDAGEVNLSHEGDMVPVFQSQTFNADLDADNIHGVLEANGIESFIERGPFVNTTGIQVLVAQEDLARAQSVIAEALAAGPQAAAEAEKETEG